MNLQELQVRYTEKLNRQEELLNVIDSEQRDFTETEQSEFDVLSRDITAISKSIQAEQKKEEIRSQIALNKMNRGEAKKSEEQKVTESFSLLRAISNLSKGINPDNMGGAEGEMHQEAVREARANGTNIMGYGLPAFMVRAQDAATAATAGNLIATNLDSNLIPALRPKLFTQELGATTLSGLIGNLNLPASDALATANWETETGAADNTDPSTRLVALAPNRLAAVTTVSKQLMVQSSFDVEAWIRGELSNAIARAVDTAAISGNGSGISGILSTAGVLDVTFGGAVTRAKLIDLQSKVSVNDADVPTMAYLMNPIIRGELQSLKTDTGSGLFVMPSPSELLGYRAFASTLVPTNIDVNKTCVIFADWSQLVIAQWGGTDLIVDPYSAAATGQVKIVVNSFWDVALKQPKAFAKGDDITFTAI